MEPPNPGPAMNSSYRTRNGFTSTKGAFLNKVWHCDCDPRLPADKFQTKNGGKNHGRWFYTCHKPQPKRCSFFLWIDDAKVREEAAVLNNSTSEPEPVPTTPRKPTRTQAPVTPYSKERARTRADTIGLTTDSQTIKGDSAPEELVREASFEWPSSDGVELAQGASRATIPRPLETPRKAARTDTFTSPGKRTHVEMQDSSIVSWPGQNTMAEDDDVFTTPTTSNRKNGLLSPVDTPAKHLLQSVISNTLEPSSLAASALSVLRPANISKDIESELVALLNQHDLQTQGIAKGRDITRLAVKAKDKQILQLQDRIGQLEAEKETSRAVIAHLKQDIALKAASSRKGRSRGRGGQG